MNGDHHETNNNDQKTPLLPIHRSQSMNSFIQSVFTLKNLFTILGPSLCIFICLFIKMENAPSTSTNMLGVLAWIFTWWLSEAVPMPVTSMSPLFLFPLFGISSSDEVAQSYMDDVIALVLGSFILALAVEHYNIHRRLALNVSNSNFFFLFFRYFMIRLLENNNITESLSYIHRCMSVFRYKENYNFVFEK